MAQRAPPLPAVLNSPCVILLQSLQSLGDTMTLNIPVQAHLNRVYSLKGIPMLSRDPQSVN